MAVAVEDGGTGRGPRRLTRLSRRQKVALGATLLVVGAGGIGAVQLQGAEQSSTLEYASRPSAGAAAYSTTTVAVAADGDSFAVGSSGAAASAPYRSGGALAGSSAGAAVPTSVPRSAVPAASGPRIVRTVLLAVEVPKGGVGAAASKVASIATAAGGFVQTSSSSTEGEGAGLANAVIRVPSAKAAEVTDQLAALGKVTSRKEGGEDVSGQLVDLDARIRNLRSQEESLRTLLARAGSVGEVLSVQQTLFDVRGQIEQLAGQQASLASAADLATITVDVREPVAVTPVKATGQAEGERSLLTRTADTFVDSATFVATAILVGGAAIAPFAVVVAAIALVVALVRSVRRRRDLTPDARPAAP